MKKIFLTLMLAILCGVALALTDMPAKADIVASGTCGANGDNLTWELDSDGVLTISGEGEMEDFRSSSIPWYSEHNSIRSVSISPEVTSIGSRSFLYCVNLTSVIIPEGITSIGGSAFYSCKNLTTIQLPESLKVIYSNAFTACSSLNIIHLSSIQSWLSIDYLDKFSHPNCSSSGCHLFIENCELTNISIPSEITSINSYAFSNCTGLTSVTIPQSVTSIDSSAFSNCSNLKSFLISPGNTQYCSENGVLYDKSKTQLLSYPSGKADSTFTIPSNVNCIGPNAFSYCRNLVSVTIPSSVTDIGEEAFSECSNLASIILPESITNIACKAFINCGGLTNIVLPASIT